MGIGRKQWVEIVRALIVLALVFLNFGHAPTELRIGSEFSLGALETSLCGGALNDEDPLAGNPCEACRIASGLDLPPAPCAEALVLASFEQLRHAVIAAPLIDRFGRTPASPRAPPTA